MSSCRVYIGRLSYQAKEKDVERFFRGFGRIRDINLKNGFGFVEFDSPRDADDAVYECNGQEMLGERIIVEHARGSSAGFGGRFSGRGGGYESRDRGGHGGRREPVWLGKYGPPTRTEHRLIVENLSSRVSWQDLKDFMRQAGEITYADAHKQRVGEGVVEYATRDDMKSAIRKLDGTELNGRRLRLVEERVGGSSRHRSRSHSRDRSRSRSRDRSRSRSRSGSRSRSRSRSNSRSRSKSPRERRRTRSRSRSRENSESRRSRSASKSPAPATAVVNGEGEGGKEDRDSRSRSRSPENGPLHFASPEKGRSHSPAQDQEMRSRSGSPAREDGHED